MVPFDDAVMEVCNKIQWLCKCDRDVNDSFKILILSMSTNDEFNFRQIHDIWSIDDWCIDLFVLFIIAMP